MEKTTKRSAIMKARYKCVYAFSSWQALFFFVDNDAFIARANYLFSLSCFLFFFYFFFHSISPYFFPCVLSFLRNMQEPLSSCDLE